MSLLSWNCQGAGSIETVRQLREFRRKFFPDFIFLMETKQQDPFIINLRDSLGYECSVTMEPHGLSGGLAVFWKKSYTVSVLHYDARVIDLAVKLGTLEFFLTCVYGDPVRGNRNQVWDFLSNIGSVRDEAWILMGDFNEILDNSEKKGGPLRAESTFWDFRNLVTNCKIRELQSSGNRFSWGGWRDNMWIQCCLDRSFGNDNWFTAFPRAHMEFLELWASDHRPVLISFIAEGNIRDTNRFYYDSRWKTKEGMVEAVATGWNTSSNEGEASVSDRIKNCRHELSKWKRRNNTNAEIEIKRLKRKLEEEVSKVYPDHHAMFQIKRKLSEAYRDEELYWKARSKEHWLKAGDRNTAYFHNSVKQKKVKNRIHMLIDDDGREQFNEGSKGQVAVDYFRKLFTSSLLEDMDNILEEFTPRVKEEMNVDLVKPVTDAEIKLAVFNIKGESGPGSDGFTGKFYQQHWGTVGEAVCKEIKDFFNLGLFPTDWNFTNLCLIPKVTNPTKMTELRPISLCSVQYKIISKILCSRLKPILPDIISDTQGAFVSGRLISDNVLIAHEMVHALRTNDIASEEFMVVKTDMSKAYDRVEWPFLEKLMSKMGFHDQWIQWVMKCVSTVSYSVLINEKAHGFIKPERGLRQGDPLSPFLFIMCAEALVNVLNRAERAEKLTGIKASSTGPAVHHLLFADDSMLMCKATISESMELKRCLRLYERASGQTINFQKSSIIFGDKVRDSRKLAIKRCLGIEQEGGEGFYLGLPECFNGSKIKILNFIREKLQERLHGWFAKSLSQGGKEILLKSVAMSLPVYAMSCFKLPKDTCKRITSAMTEFWWNNEKEHRKIPWVAWKTMCRQKEKGGLGFRDVERFNQALLGKQAWRIFDNPNSLLARILKHKYFRNKSFLDCGSGSRPSYGWRSILWGREILKKGLLMKVGNGESIRVWKDNWLEDEFPRPATRFYDGIDEELRVSDLWHPNSTTWNIPLLRHYFNERDVNLIIRIRPNPTRGDVIKWHYSGHGEYTTKSAYKLSEDLLEAEEHQNENIQPVETRQWARIWKLKAPPKIRHFFWRASKGALAVAERLNTRGLNVPVICPSCNLGPETVCHVLFLCPMASQVWNAANLPIPRSGFSQNSIFINLHHVLACCENTRIPVATRRAFPWVLWHIWLARNAFTFEKTRISFDILVERAYEETDEWFMANRPSEQVQLVVNSVAPIRRHWEPPPSTFTKCSIGNEWCMRNSLSGVAWILRDQDGTVLFHSRSSFSSVQSKLDSELLSLLWAVENMGNMNQSKVIFETSSEQVIRIMEKPAEHLNKEPLLSEIFSHLNKLVEWNIIRSPETCLVPAGKIAQSVILEQRHQTYIARGGPSWLRALLLSEKIYSHS